MLPALAGAREMASTPAAPVAPEAGGFELSELTIADLQAAIASGKYSVQGLTEKYLARIEQVDRRGPALNAPGYFRKSLRDHGTSSLAREFIRHRRWDQCELRDCVLHLRSFRFAGCFAAG